MYGNELLLKICTNVQILLCNNHIIRVALVKYRASIVLESPPIGTYIYRLYVQTHSHTHTHMYRLVVMIYTAYSKSGALLIRTPEEVKKCPGFCFQGEEGLCYSILHPPPESARRPDDGDMIACEYHGDQCGMDTAAIFAYRWNGLCAWYMYM